MNSCIQCGKAEIPRVNKYCSNQCQLDYQYFRYIEQWKQGQVDGARGLTAKNISGHLRRYLQEKYGDACSLCAWSQKNPATGRVPLEIDHTDGNSDNNVEENLRLICPNCHALTTNFRNLNKGNGRNWRKLKYLKSN